MNLYELIMTRRSVRNFDARPVPAEIIDELLEAAVNAPSGGNIQPLSIIVVRDPARREELAKIVGGQPWVKNAPLSLVFCVDFFRVKKWASMFNVDFRGEDSFALFLIAYADLMCAAQTVALLAHGHGLGSVYVGTIQSNIDRARQFFMTPEYVLPMMVLTLGYPRSIPSSIPKLPRSAIIHNERYHLLAECDIRDSYEKKYGRLDEDVDKYLEKTYVEALEADRQEDTGWVDRVKQRMKKLEIKSNAEFLFRLRYPSEAFVRMNERMARALRDAGFSFLSRPPGSST